jgi:hypothetical protein
MILEIKVKSRIKGVAALDNVARFLKRTENGWGIHRGAKWEPPSGEGTHSKPRGAPVFSPPIKF